MNHDDYYLSRRSGPFMGFYPVRIISILKSQKLTNFSVNQSFKNSFLLCQKNSYLFPFCCFDSGKLAVIILKQFRSNLKFVEVIQKACLKSVS